MNTLLFRSSAMCGDLSKIIEEMAPGLYSTTNFEQVLAMVKLGEVSKIFILVGGSMIDGKDAAEAIHKIDPKIPVLIYGSNESRIFPNEAYMDQGMKNEEFYKTVKEFYFRSS
jgi:hypothetical protein